MSTTPSKTPTHIADAKFKPSPLNATIVGIEHMAGRVHISPRRTKVCIYGAGIGKEQAPLDDESWEVWALNLIAPLDSAGRLRCDRWFDIHQRKAQTADDLRWINKCPVPLYVPDDLLDAGPNCVRYPLERVEAEYGSYWSCTFAYQIALAMLEGFKEIGLYGVELAFGTQRERSVEWACVSWWMGYVEARGVTFHLPPNSRMGAHPFRYGFEYQEEIDEVKKYVKRVNPRYGLVEGDDDEKPSVGG